MALIGTIRSKMGTWVVVFVFLAIVSFILTDLLGNNSVLFNDNSVGEIAGTTISAEEYQNALDEREANYILNFGRKPGERELSTLRSQAWEMLILRHAIQNEFKKVGVTVTARELEDMVWGKNVDENIKSTPLFQDPATGAFDKNRILQYLKEIKNPPVNADPQMAQMWQEQRTRWEIFQRDLGPGRERIKYEQLLIKSNYVTAAEAEREYHNQTDVAEVKYLYVPFFAVSDSVEVTDADVKNYYEKNKERFKTKESRDIEFVTFPVAASSEDSAAVMNEMKRIATELAQTDDDSAYATSNTEGAEAFAKYNAGNLPAFVKQEDLKQGNVVGPFLDGGSYKVLKVTSIKKDTVFSARAAHILIKWDNETDAAKKAAKEKARDILKKIKGGASFASMALEHGTDGTASKGGDLGWFTEGTMVKRFNDAVFGATKPGLLNDVVETEFGYHIVSITNVKDNTAYEVAIVENVITPSDATTSAAYRKAESFQLDLTSTQEFRDRAKSEGLTVQEAKGLTAGDFRVGALGSARQVVAWLYREGEEGKVSSVLDQKDEYVVAVMTKETEAGYKPLSEVKADITPDARKDVKARIIIEKLKGLKGSLDEMATAYGKDAAVYSSSDLKLSQGSLPSAGFDPVAVGVAFSLENGKRSEPFKGENGVFVMEAQNITVAPAIADYEPYKMPIQQNMQTRSSFNIAEAIKENAGIEDKRYKVN